MHDNDAASGTAGPKLARETDMYSAADRIAGRHPDRAVELIRRGRHLVAQDPTSQAVYAFVLARACCLAGQIDAAVHELRAALETEDVFWWPRLLGEFPGVGEALAEHPDYGELVALTRARWQAAQMAATQGEPIVKTHDTDDIRGVVYVWHGATAEPEVFARLWSKPARRAGLALVVPRGPVVSCTGLRGWEPEHAGEAVLAAHEAAVRHGLGELPKVFAGFCLGAAIAIGAALADTEHDLRPRGLVAIAPPFIAATSAGLTRAADSKFRVSVLRGEHDWFAEPTDSFTRALASAGVRSRAALMPGVGHSFSRFLALGSNALRFAFGD
jgi:hypothetical protein